MRLFTYITLVLLIALSSCTAQKSTPETYQKRQITLGKGGGFTGMVTAYTFMENGLVFKLDAKGQKPDFIGKIKKSEMKQFLLLSVAADLKNSDFNHPSNMYQFIELKEDAEIFRTTWGDPAHTVPANISKLFDDMLAIAEKLNTDAKSVQTN